MNISEIIQQLEKEKADNEQIEKLAHDRVIEINAKLKKLRTQEQKFLKILKSGQGAAE